MRIRISQNLPDRENVVAGSIITHRSCKQRWGGLAGRGCWWRWWWRWCMRHFCALWSPRGSRTPTCIAGVRSVIDCVFLHCVFRSVCKQAYGSDLENFLRGKPLRGVEGAPCPCGACVAPAPYREVRRMLVCLYCLLFVLRRAADCVLVSGARGTVHGGKFPLRHVQGGRPRPVLGQISGSGTGPRCQPRAACTARSQPEQSTRSEELGQMLDGEHGRCWMAR